MRGCVVIQRMDLMLVMATKAVLIVGWALFSEWIWPESVPEVTEQRTCTASPQRLLCLPAPEQAPSLAESR